MSALPPTDPFERRYERVLVVSKGAPSELVEAETSRALEILFREMERAIGYGRDVLPEHFTFIWNEFRPVISFDEDTGKARVVRDMLRASWEALPKRIPS